MSKRLTQADAERLRKNAKRLKKSRAGTSEPLPHSEALNAVAQEYGFSSWEILMRHLDEEEPPANAAVPPQQGTGTDLIDEREVPAPPLHKQALHACRELVRDLSARDVERLCMSGTIWVDRDDVWLGRITKESLVVPGYRHDGLTTQDANHLDAALLVDMDGLGDRFVMPGDVDENDEPAAPGKDQIRYTTEVGRSELLEIIESEADCFADRLQDIAEAP